MPADIPVSRRKALAIAGCCLGFSRLLGAAEQAPGFAAKTLTGETFNNKSLLGKVALIQFWASWCPHCRSDAEPLDDLAAEFEKDGLVVLAVNVTESKKVVKAFLAKDPRKTTRFVMMEDTNLAAMFAANSFPMYVLIDREGRVAGRQNGAGGEDALRRLLRKAGLGSGGDDDAPVELQSSPRRGN